MVYICQGNRKGESAGLKAAHLRCEILVKAPGYRKEEQILYPSGNARILTL